MTDALFSPSWYRVAELKPRLRTHVQIHRHDYRGRLWYVLQDHSVERSHRFSPAAYRFIGLMDGERTVQEIWEATNAQLDDDAPTQEEVIRLLGQLHAADTLLCDVPPDSLELFRRHQRHQRLQWRRRLWSPLAVRFPLFDPERFLERSLPVVRPLFGWLGALMWLVVVVAGAILAVMHWPDLTENIVDRALTPHNLLLLWTVYPIVKGLHEFGHGYATKVWGGEVHEMGIMLLVLMPVPYVDASASTAFRDKYQRMAVGAAGIAVELFLGALALFVWLNVEPGAVHSVAYNVMLISGVSTLFFNGNPLLRFDGYYVLADALEIPNLGTRSTKYFGYLSQRYLFGVREADSPATSRGERVWFVVYGLAAFAYRMMIMFIIILYIAGKFFVVGVLLAIWAILTQLVVPMAKRTSFLLSNPRLNRKRTRAVTVSALLVAALIALLLLVPAPLWTRAEGVTWPPERSQVRAGTDGFIARVLVEEDSLVRRGQALIETEAPFLRAHVQVLEAQLRELEARLMAGQLKNRVQAAVIREEMAAVEGDLARARERAAALTMRSPQDGTFVVPDAEDLPGRFARQGQVLGYVVDPSDLTARVVVSQDEIGLVRRRTRNVQVMLADWGAQVHPAEIRRAVPGGTDQLPTPALGTGGGGPFAVAPGDPEGRTTLERVFHLEVTIPATPDMTYLGGRVYVRFDHGFEPLGFQLYRALRQLFLRRFGV